MMHFSVKRHYVVLVLLYCFICINQNIAQNNSLPKAKNPNRTKIIALPFLSYSPDTRWGGGAGGLLTFNMRNDTLGARRSSTTFGLTYTQLHQILLQIPYQLFFKKQQHWVYGELGYYRYVYNYFGVGNENTGELLEKYDAQYPRIRLNVLTRMKQHLYAGIRYQFEDFQIQPRVQNGDIATGRILGSKGGRISGAGLVLNLDTRNSIFFPTKGQLTELFVYTEMRALGSDFSNRRISFSTSRYFGLAKRTVLAFNSQTVLTRGAIAFHQLPSLGGSKQLRGYYDRQFIDRNMLLLQSELRFPLLKWLGGAAFVGTGTVVERLSDIRARYMRTSGGAGLRILLDKKQGIHARLDFGIGRLNKGFYVTMGEAF